MSLHRPSSSAEDPILRELAELPRESASAGFTAGLVARARAVDRTAPRLPRAALAAAAVLVLVSGIAAWRLEQERRRDDWLDQVQTLQLESERLQRELDDLRAAEAPPILYLGGDDQVDLFLDLAEGTRSRGVQPASLSATQPPRGGQR
jgi:hypothetical protein